MKFKELLSEAIDNDTKIIITGYSGWGKSEMVTQVAEEKGLELIDFRLSEILPEDLVGIPKVQGDYYEYVPPKWLYEVVQHPEKKYLLFLDEITQGTPEVLNICYKIFDKVTKVGNYTLTNVAVVGATNFQSESNYLNELPEPLRKRACNLQLSHDVNSAAEYLMNKYNLNGTRIKDAFKECIKESNPRSTEKALTLVLNNCSKELSAAYVGFTQYQNLKSAVGIALKPEALTQVDKALADIDNGFTLLNDQRYKISEPLVLKYQYVLTDEEYDIVKQRFERGEIPSVSAKRTFFTDWALSRQNLTTKDLEELSKTSSFNINNYIRKVRITKALLDKQMVAMCELSNCPSVADLFTKMIQFGKIIPIDVMREYKKYMPWDLIKEQNRQGLLTEAKQKEFAKELA